MLKTISYNINSEKDYEVVFNKITEIDLNLILLTGDLGAGKTTFVGLFLNHIASKDEVKAQGFMSPTFSIINQYDLKCGLVSHVDLYRLNYDEIQDLGLDELVQESKYTFIEWYKNNETLSKSLSKKKVIIELKKVDENIREISLFF